jgi:hypothetical protein
MTVTFRAAELANDQLTEKLLEQPTAESLTGETKTRSHVFFQGEEQKTTSGTWECEPAPALCFPSAGVVTGPHTKPCAKYLLSTARKLSDLLRAVANS